MRRPHLLLLLVVLAVLRPTDGRAAAATATAPAVAAPAFTSTSIVPPGAPQSKFVDEPGVGSDPFFPKSSRRTPKVSVATTPADLNPQEVPGFISLKGISVIKDKKLAIINNYTLEQGEEFSLRNGTQIFKIKCIEVKENSAIITVNGVTKELTLRSRFN